MSPKYDLIFISSCINSKEIFNLIFSLNTDRTFLKKLLIITNMSGVNISVHNKINYDLFIINEDKILNSSQSRNLCINYLIKNKVSSKYYAFPDDDSTYDSSFFNFLYSQIYLSNDKLSNLVFDVKCRENLNLFYRSKIDNKVRKITKYDFDSIGAVNIIVNSFTFFNVGLFNEKFGVGSFYGAGEDGDYFLRALKFNEFYYFPNLYTIHPSSSKILYNNNLKFLKIRMFNYSRGVIKVLCSHKLIFYAVYISLRPLAPFIYNLGSLNFNLSLLFFKVFLFRLYLIFKYS